MTDLMETIRKVEEVMFLVDRSCDCNDGTCRVCRCIDLLLRIKDDLENLIT